MPKIPINDKPTYNFSSTVSYEFEDVLNCVFSSVPNVGLAFQRRRGLIDTSGFIEIDTSIFGVVSSVTPAGSFYWKAEKKLIFALDIQASSAAGIYLFVFDTSLGTATFINSQLGLIGHNNDVSFADGQKLDGTPVLYAAHGKMLYTDDSCATWSFAGAGAPTDAISIAYQNLRFFAMSQDSNKVSFTGVNPATGELDHDYWLDSDSPLSSDAKGDIGVGIYSFKRDLGVCGEEAVEFFYDDGVTPYSSIQGSLLEVGLLAADSLVTIDNALYGVFVVDGLPAVGRIRNRNFENISAPIQEVLHRALPSITEQFESRYFHAYSLPYNDTVLYVLDYGLTFGSSIFGFGGFTLVYDIKNDVWSNWVSWDSNDNKFTNLVGTNGVFDLSVGATYFLDKGSNYNYSTNRLPVLGLLKDENSLAPTLHMDDYGEPIKMIRRTLWMDHDTSKRKRVINFRLKLRRGFFSDGTVSVRYADNGSDVWSPYINIQTGPIGSKEQFIDLGPMGTYRSRRYEISCSDEIDPVIIYAEEDIEVLDS